MARHDESAEFGRQSDRDWWGLNAALVLAALAVALLGWRWWESQQSAPPADAAAVAPAGPADEVAPAASASALNAPAASSNAAPLYPIEPPSASAAGPAVTLGTADARLRPALTGLFGQLAFSKFVQSDDLVRRLVASVDNLTRSDAPGARWPLQPVPGRFGAGGATRGDDRYAALDAANSARYTPAVRFAESVDVAQAVALYRQHYALFQQAYEELGYPNRYFNDRLVAVVDHLLAAPEPAEPPRVARLEIKGPYQDAHPWSRYEFVDPDLESLSAGQKMMVRLGLDNERRIKAKLRELRAAVTANSAVAKR